MRVQRNSSFSKDHHGLLEPSRISFESVQLNEGGAMNPITGTYTFPVPGIYKFEFTAHFSTPEEKTIGQIFNNSS